MAGQIAFFSKTAIDGSAVQRALSQARVVVVGTGAVAEDAVDRLEDAGMPSVAVAAAEFSEAAVHGAACTLVCYDSPAPDLLRTVNAAALKAGWPWIPGGIGSGLGVIGPAVIPGQSACYTCFDLRRNANLGARPTPAGAGAPGPLAGAVASLLVLDAMRLVSRLAPPQSLNRVAIIDFFATGMVSHRVLRLPNCPDCGYGSRRLPQMTAAGA